MEKHINFWTPALAFSLAIGLVDSVQAQRGVTPGGNLDRGGRQLRVESRGANISRERPSLPSQPRTGGFVNGQSNIDRQNRTNELRRPNFNNNQQNRNVQSRSSENLSQRGGNPSWERNNSSNYSRNYGSRGYSKRNYYNSNRNYYNHRNSYVYYAPRYYHYVGAPRYAVLPRTSIFINFGGYPYYYNDGLFFNYYGGYYQPVYAPRGIRVGVLPFGYIAFNFGPKRYYYYNGIYYLPFNNDKEYEVVDAPVGAQISDLPKGAKSVTVNGEKFYEFNGTYYKKDVDSKGKEVYTVTGKNGEVNNTEEAPQITGQPLKVGDMLPQLPDGTRSVMENGQQVFVAPDGTYFKLHSDGKTTGYLVTALPPENKLPVGEQEL